MKFILNKDRLTIEDEETQNSGSVKYYEADVEYDESWNNLIIEAVLVQREGSAYADEGKGISVINNKVYIDNELSGSFGIGFVGYTIEDEVKTYQISTNLQCIWFEKGAGEIEISNEIPSINEWEIYIAQIQEMLNEYSGVPKGGTTGQVLKKKSNTDGDAEWSTDIHLSNAYLDDSSDDAILVLEMNNGTSFRIDLGNLAPSTDIQLVTTDNKVFLTKNDEKFILKEEE